MPATWTTVLIKELYEGLYDGPHATPKTSEEGPVFLGIKNVTDDGHLDLSDIRHIAEEDFATWTRRVEPRPGDIVFTYEATLNRYAILAEGFRGCLGRRMALIRTDPKKVYTGFLFYYFFSPAWREVITNNVMSGATVDRIPLVTFPNFPVNVPPLPLQRRIADILSGYDDLIENIERRIRILEDMSRALYREWFVHFRFPGHKRVPHVASSLGDIPKGWEVRPLEAVCERITDGSHLSPPSVNEGYPMASVKDMRDWGINVESCRKISAEDYEDLVRNNCKPLRNDVLIAKDGSYLKHTFVVGEEQDLVVLSSIAILRPKSLIRPNYLSFTLREPVTKARMTGFVSGVAIPRIVLKDFRKFQILVPPPDVQIAWARHVDPKVRIVSDLDFPNSKPTPGARPAAAASGVGALNLMENRVMPNTPTQLAT